MGVGPSLGFALEEVSLTSPRLRPGGPSLCLAHLSDLHLRRVRDRHRRLVRLLKERRPDVLCLTGDIIARPPATWEACAELLPRLAEGQPTFACAGNWEADFRGRQAELRAMMAGWGVELLVNESRTLDTPAGPVRVAGVDDMALGWPSFQDALGGGDGTAYTVLLSHAPLGMRFLTDERRADLVLSGHTHGGQIRVPLLWRLFLPLGHGGFVADLHRVGGAQLYVSRGFGAAAWLPFRFRCPAEVAFIEVRSA
jgi:hypothetical protein